MYCLLELPVIINPRYDFMLIAWRNSPKGRKLFLINKACFYLDVLREGNLANLYNGLETMVETVLPIGKASLNYEMDIIAMVSDKYGYATKTSLKVQVIHKILLTLMP